MIVYCKICNERIANQAEVVATVVCRHVELKSKVIYSLTKPHDCYGIVHKECFKRDLD